MLWFEKKTQNESLHPTLQVMATIIKGRNQANPTERTVRSAAYDLSDLSGQADTYLNTVRSEATKIIQQAKEESARISQRAEEAGRQAAEQAIERILNEKVAKQMGTLVPALRSAVAQIEDAQGEWSTHWEKSLVQLATSIAERIVRREIRAQPEIPQQWIAEALQMVAGSAKVTLRLNPTDYETLTGYENHLTKAFGSTATAQMVSDESISLSGCIVETEFGSIDQQIETQLERVQQELS